MASDVSRHVAEMSHVAEMLPFGQQKGHADI
jgi:hypothetical protein